MMTKSRLFAFAFASATFTTALLVADTASARYRIPSANAINKVQTLPGHIAFASRANYPGGGNGRKDNAGSDNSTSRN